MARDTFCQVCRKDHGTDAEPCCPRCNHYNAMLGTGEYIKPGVWATEVTKCRDCGYELRPVVEQVTDAENTLMEGTVAEFEETVDAGGSISLCGLSKAIQREKAPAAAPENEFDRIQAAKGKAVPVSETTYEYALGVLPPIYSKFWFPGDDVGMQMFAMGETHHYDRDCPAYYWFTVYQLKHYSVLATEEDAQEAFRQLAPKTVDEMATELVETLGKCPHCGFGDGVDTHNPEAHAEAKAAATNITNNEIRHLITHRGLTLTQVIDVVCELNGFVGVGFFTFGDQIRTYIQNLAKNAPTYRKDFYREPDALVLQEEV